jgi:hypothetical protein
MSLSLLLLFISGSRDKGLAHRPANNMRTYITRDKEAGNPIAEFDTLDEAVKAVDQYIENDKADGSYSVDFYEVYNYVTGEVVYVG